MNIRRFLWSMAAGIFFCGRIATAWEQSPPSQQGVNPAAIWDFVQEVEKNMMDSGDAANGAMHGFLLIKNGKEIAEGWWAPFRSETPRQLFSISKSFTSTAIGFAVQEKLLSIDDPVVKFFPDKLPDKPSERLMKMKIRDLLTMQSGHEECTIGAMFQGEKDMVSNFLALEIPHDPGTFFVYNNGATYMLSAIVSQVTGQSVLDYLKPRFFAPLGIENVTWDADKNGINFGAWGLYLTAEDLAKFAQFYLQKGKWDGKQLLNAEWIALATSVQSHSPSGEADWQQGYGFQIWRGQHGSYRADGYLSQYAIVLEKENAILILFCSSCNMHVPLESAWKTLLPALRGDYTTDRTLSDTELAERLTKLTLTMPTATKEPVLYQDGDELELQVENEEKTIAMRLVFSADRCTLELDGHSVEYGLGNWLTHEAEPDTDWPWGRKFSGQAFWTAPNELTLVDLPPDSPFQTSLTITFEGNEITTRRRIADDIAIETQKGEILHSNTKKEEKK